MDVCIYVMHSSALYRICIVTSPRLALCNDAVFGDRHHHPTFRRRGMRRDSGQKCHGSESARFAVSLRNIGI